LIASASKLASLVLFLNLFTVALPGQAGSAAFGSPQAGWTMVIAVFAAASMVFGNLVALAQRNLRRLIAYSAVAHAGYVLLAVLAPGSTGAVAGVFYLFTYGLSVIGIFGIIRIIEDHDGDLNIPGLDGLSNRAPFLAVCLFVFILSLAGIPPLAGFFGKFYLFIAALDGAGAGNMPGLLWLVILAVGASTVSLYYYLIVLKHAFVVPSSELAPLKVPRCQLLVLCILAGAVVLLGCVPNLLVGPLRASLPHLLAP
jgi:NADH-quinone oxidoreductase subunit N